LGIIGQEANVYFGSLNDSTDYFQIRDKDNSSLVSSAYGSTKVEVGTWYHLAYVYKDTNILIYVNGNYSGRASGRVASSAQNIVRENNFIGMAQGKSYVNVLNAVLDEIKLYNKALTQEEVELDMEAVDGITSGIC
jgi:hypothetical protein